MEKGEEYFGFCASYSTFVIGWPQQTSWPMPFSMTFTLLPQISQR